VLNLSSVLIHNGETKTGETIRGRVELDSRIHFLAPTTNQNIQRPKISEEHPHDSIDTGQEETKSKAFIQVLEFRGC
jgi:hypothetical protein